MRRDPNARPTSGGAPDERATRLLRALVAPPADGSYWDGLEARVMARVRAERREILERRAGGLWGALWGGGGRGGRRGWGERSAGGLGLPRAQRPAVASTLDARHAKIDSLLRP